MNSNFNFEDLYLSALLHDIGKFYQRTELEEDKKIIYKAYESIFKAENAYGPRHQEWGAYFCENLNLNSKIVQTVRNHHNPSTIIEKIVRIADMLSAGEREGIDDKDENVKNLISVLTLVNIGKPTKSKYKQLKKASDYHELIDDEQKSVEKEYEKLWKEFKEIIKDEKDHERIYYILKEFTQNIPSAYYYSRPDISLFSHLSTTAAIASCIYRQYEDEIINGDSRAIDSLLTRLRNKQTINDEVFCLLKGDISGIQDFIFNIDMEGALKSLRGRSFYVAYILDIIARYIIKNEGLSLSNILYSGGGHFYILLPAKSMDRIKQYQKYIDEVFYKAHNLEVSVLLAAEKFSVSKLATANFSEVFDGVGKRLYKEKNRKFNSILNDEFFKPTKLLDDICPYCRREIKNDECSFCNSFNELGDKLSKYSYIRMENIEAKIGNINNVFDIFKCFGIDMQFENQGSKKSYAINKDRADFKNSMFYIKTANYVYKNKNGVATLENVADESDGVKKWGILRGDVDNLGKIFHDGLGENKSISRVATLSSELEIFFGKFLEEFIEKEYKKCSVVYSGGDDFFLVGPWSELPDVAYLIKEKLKEYSGGNENIAVSMAIEITPDKKFPIYRVGIATGESLDKAKEYERNGKAKDAIFLFGKAIGWEEFNSHKEIKDLIVKVLVNKVTRNILNIFHSISYQSRKAEEKEEIFKAWRLVYYMARLEERYGKSKDDLKRLLNLILNKQNRLYKNLESATIWADLQTRS
ncbi:type III-A CRISPR-associated protein Cas10/Csm1 [Caloramator australicus]|uniref:CRISPR system single-strand-specific deoxyribonuclease Cas10/Csm1 (subtype III-A) n=1 Tax=Caloramator australicus RC3 TaxID=857293 RepID=I7LIC7_9CLOT|nr:type III-A CRISPR-associated protein Cas10/Csm1 [Caloramator australicus]CCJ34758.1 CRISPR-associated protein, Csm1 family [Caloramator australicus RC3]